MKSALFGALLFERLLGLGIVQFPSPEIWARADAATVRLAPSAFKDLPSNLRAELERRGCLVPQIPTIGAAHNVIHGHFRRSDQVDWAVLCSRDRVSTIVVFWGARPTAVSEIGRKPDATFLQSSRTEIVFSRQITVVSMESLIERYRRSRSPLRARPDHEGIVDAFVDKASDVWYWDREKWLGLPWSD